jgi:hypothetical protein
MQIIYNIPQSRLPPASWSSSSSSSDDEEEDDDDVEEEDDDDVDEEGSTYGRSSAHDLVSKRELQRPILPTMMVGALSNFLERGSYTCRTDSW